MNYLMPRVPYPTGTVQVTLAEGGIPTYEIKEGVAWDNIPYTDEMAEIAKNARAVCFGSLAQRNKVSRENIRLPEDLRHQPASAILFKRGARRLIPTVQYPENQR